MSKMKAVKATLRAAGAKAGRGAKAAGRQVTRGAKGQGVKYDVKRLRAVLKGQRVAGGAAGTGRLTKKQAAAALARSTGRTALVYGGGAGAVVGAKKAVSDDIFTPFEREALQDACFEALMELE